MNLACSSDPETPSRPVELADVAAEAGEWVLERPAGAVSVTSLVGVREGVPTVEPHQEQKRLVSETSPEHAAQWIIGPRPIEMRSR